MDSEIPIADSSRGVAPREAGTDSVGDREVEGLDQQDGSSLRMVAGYLCSHRTWESLVFRVSSKLEIAGVYTKSCNCGRGT
jgi:hypothetical protein